MFLRPYSEILSFALESSPKNFKSSIVKRFPGGVNIYYEPSGFIRMVDAARREDSEEYK